MRKSKGAIASKIIIFIICVILALISIMPFWIMIVNSTRSTTEIQQHAVSLIPSGYFLNNLKVLLGKSFDRICDGSRAGRERQSRDSPFQGCNSFFKHVLCGVCESAVDIAGIGQSESRGRVGAVVKYV